MKFTEVIFEDSVFLCVWRSDPCGRSEIKNISLSFSLFINVNSYRFFPSKRDSFSSVASCVCRAASTSPWRRFKSVWEEEVSVTAEVSQRVLKVVPVMEYWLLTGLEGGWIRGRLEPDSCSSCPRPGKRTETLFVSAFLLLRVQKSEAPLTALSLEPCPLVDTQEDEERLSFIQR